MDCHVSCSLTHYNNSRLSHITSPSTAAFMRIFRLSYFYMPASTTPMSTLKQCLHYDPDSKPCLTAHRLVKALDKSFKKLDTLMSSESWRALIDFLLGTDADHKTGLLGTYDDALDVHGSPALLDLPSNVLVARPQRTSPRRQEMLRALCRSYLQLGQARAGERWCDELLGMLGAEKDIDGLLGKGEALLVREEWEEAVRVFQMAMDASGNGNREVSRAFDCSVNER